MEKRITTASSLKEGSFVMIEGVPCKVVSIQTSKPGKHGSAKARIEGVGIVDGRRRVLIVPSHARVEVPIIEKRNAQIISISGEMASAMDTESYETFDIEIPEEFKGKVKEGDVILYWDVMGVKLMKGIVKSA